MPYADPKKYKEYQTAYRDKNRSKAREYFKERELTPEQLEKRRKYLREYYHKNKGWWDEKRASKYGITADEHKELLSRAGSKCPICSRDFGKKGPSIDHCHETGVIRGLICQKCNIAEGLMGDPENALRLYEYMKKNQLLRQGRN